MCVVCVSGVCASACVAEEWDFPRWKLASSGQTVASWRIPGRGPPAWLLRRPGMWGSQTVWVWPECQVARQAGLPRLSGWRVLGKVMLAGKEGGGLGMPAQGRSIHDSTGQRVERRLTLPSLVGPTAISLPLHQENCQCLSEVWRHDSCCE